MPYTVDSDKVDTRESGLAMTAAENYGILIQYYIVHLDAGKAIFFFYTQSYT